MRKLPRHLTSLYLALTIVAGLFMAPSVTVLCVGPGGHIEIEKGSLRCHDSNAGSDGRAVNRGTRVERDDCGPCVDLQLGLSEAQLGCQGAATSQPKVSSWAFVGAPGVRTCTESATQRGKNATSESISARPPTRAAILRN